VLRALLLLALAGLALVSFLSWLGDVAGPLDLLSHLRLHFAVAAGLLLLAHLMARQFWAGAMAGLLVAANLAGSVIYPHRSIAAEAPPSARVLTLVTFNARWAADNAARIVGFLEHEQADIVVLEEMTPEKAAQILPPLQSLYPWQVNCSTDVFCRLALLSRHRWEDASAERRGPDEVATAIADFGPDLGRLRVIGVHLMRPWPWWDAHRQQIDSLIPLAKAPPRPVIMLGDFNATPWSRTMRAISAGTGLLPSGSYDPSWPLRLSRLKEVRLFPQLQLDQLLLPDGVTLLSIGTGPDLGSDHLPLIARIAVPAGARF
jgi:endonuclease/exonuclease/phosphatase (EEP) superfamily protein YafD